MSTSDIKVLASGLEIGDESGPHLCPFCRGGVHKEEKCYVHRLREGVLWHCFRASCPRPNGFVPVKGRAHYRELNKDEKKQRPRPYTRELYPLEAASIDFFWDAYDIPAYDYGFRQTVGGRVWMPCRDYYGRELGGSTRFYKDLAEKLDQSSSSIERNLMLPKTLTYRNEGNSVPFASWYVDDDNDRVIVVEDQISAIKLHQLGCNSIALLGVHIPMNLALEITRHFAWVDIALDPDATQQARKLQRKYNLLFDRCNLVPLPRDVKDMHWDEIKERFNL